MFGGWSIHLIGQRDTLAAAVEQSAARTIARLQAVPTLKDCPTENDGIAQCRAWSKHIAAEIRRWPVDVVLSVDAEGNGCEIKLKIDRVPFVGTIVTETPEEIAKRNQ